MKPGQRVEKAALEALQGKYTTDRGKMYCLKFVSQVVEHTYQLPDTGFYQFHLMMAQKIKKADLPHTEWCARDAEPILREVGYAVPGAETRPQTQFRN